MKRSRRCGRWVLFLMATMLAGWVFGSCSVRNEVAPGAPCSTLDPCPSSMICVDGGCTFSCDFAGDCDPGWVCVEEVCAPRCEGPDDCRDDSRCNRAPLPNVSYCGLTLVPACSSDAECPQDWRCITGGRCVDACDADAECAPNEACFAVDSYGLCRIGQRPGDFDQIEPDAGMPDVGNPNNPPVDRNCRERPAGWCEETFGQYQVCYLGECITAPRALLILDQSSGDACEPGDGPDPSGGSDIVGVYAESKSGQWATVGDIVIEDGGSDRASQIKTEMVDACFAEVGAATGCGGWIAMEARFPIEEGTVITVSEFGSSCGDLADDRYRVFLCTDVRDLILGRDTTSCTILLGEGTGQRSFEVVY